MRAADWGGDAATRQRSMASAGHGGGAASAPPRTPTRPTASRPTATAAGTEPLAGVSGGSGTPSKSGSIANLFGGGSTSSGSRAERGGSSSSTPKKTGSTAELFAPLGGALNDIVAKAKKQQHALSDAVGLGSDEKLARENTRLRLELQEKDAQVRVT